MLCKYARNSTFCVVLQYHILTDVTPVNHQAQYSMTTAKSHRGQYSMTVTMYKDKSIAGTILYCQLVQYQMISICN